MNQEHGGDVRSYAIEYGFRPLDFSANVSPLGVPAGVRRAAEAALEHGAEYPDPQCRALRQALREHLGLPSEWILCGNGASDLIYRLVAAVRPHRAMVTAPTFSEYAAALRLQGCAVEDYMLDADQDFRLTADILTRITTDLDLLFLCQPNNPTGVSIPRELLRQILARCREMGTILALDECFLEFLEAPEALTMQGQLAGHPLVILRAFTKFYGMAGLRLGYCLSADTALLERMQQAGPPWAVSSVAQAAGIAALQETEYAAALRTLIATQRPILSQGLQNLGCRVIPGEANYLLFYVAAAAPDQEGEETTEASEDATLGTRLQERGILIRDCSNYQGLGNGWYRVAVRTADENQRLLQAMQEILCPDRTQVACDQETLCPDRTQVEERGQEMACTEMISEVTPE